MKRKDSAILPNREKIFSRFFAIHNILNILPSKTKVAEYIAELLGSLPFVESYCICLESLDKTYGNLKEKECNHRHSKPSPAEEKKGLYFFSLRTVDHNYGFLKLKIKNLNEFAHFEAAINNFANSTALLLENWEQRHTLEHLNQDLEQYQQYLENVVAKRTNSLFKANQKLKKAITLRTLSEQKLKRINLAMTMLSRFNQALIREKNETSLIQQACEILVDSGNYQATWVGFLEHSQADKTICNIAHIEYHKDVRKKMQSHPQPSLKRCKYIKQLLETNQMCLRKNLTSKIAKMLHARSVIAFPLKNNQHKTYAIFAIYAKQPSAFDHQDATQILREFFDNLSFGILSLRLRIEKENATKALYESQKTLTEAQKITRLGNWDWNIKTNELSWSDEVYTIFGLKPKEFDATYETFIELVHPADRKMVNETVSLCLKHKRPYEIDHRIVLPNGKIRFIHESAKVIRDKDHKPCHMIGTALDITKTKRSEQALYQAKQDIEKTLLQTINIVTLTLEKRDPYTAGHQLRVAALSKKLAQKLKLSEKEIEAIELGATIHDLGKIQIPSEILSRPGKLLPEEMELLKTHCNVGAEIIKHIGFESHIPYNIVLQHHERLNGSGYPNQLKRKQLPIESRIVAVADVVEAMSSHRPYRPAYPIKIALEEIIKNKNKLYDANVVDACVELFEKENFAFPEIEKLFVDIDHEPRS